MICTTIINKDRQGVLEALETCEMAEIRLDSCDLSMKDIDEVFSSDVPLVATCRIAEVMAKEPSLQDPSMSDQSREIKAMQIAERKLIRAIEAGARYVDVEIEVQKQMSKRVRNAAHESGTVFIRSYHDFCGTASVEDLHNMVEKCRYHGADIVKLVTTAASEEDVQKVMSLYEWCRTEASNGVEALADGGLIAFCMGDAGKSSRIDCLKHGAPYTYAALNEQDAAAPGQMPTSEMTSAIYGDYINELARMPALTIEDLFDKDYIERHYIMLQEKNVYYSAETNNQYIQIAQELSWIDREENGYYITIPKNIPEFQYEGHIQHHCVYTMEYFKKVIGRRSIIVFLRQEENTPYVTIEFDYETFEVIQAYRKFNQNVDEELYQYIVDLGKQLKFEMMSKK
jgi:3-dehydroquinate dehydratase type I